MHKNWEVSQTESGCKLQAFLKNKLGKNFSARQVKKIIESNLCQINGRTERFASFLLGAGDQVALLNTTPICSSPIPSFERERLLYEDDTLFIYNKPAGIASDSSEWLTNLRRRHPSLTLVHRLDRETSGVLIFAKTHSAAQTMTELFKKRLINKEYLALVDGVPTHLSGTIDNYLIERHRYQGQTLWGASGEAKGLHAITEWRVEAKGPDAALIRCYPKTGRTHQLRVHLSEMGHPILGDHQYGRQFRCHYAAPRCLLHAVHINFHYPLSEKEIDADAPLPEDFRQALTQLIGNFKQ